MSRAPVSHRADVAGNEERPLLQGLVVVCVVCIVAGVLVGNPQTAVAQLEGDAATSIDHAAEAFAAGNFLAAEKAARGILTNSSNKSPGETVAEAWRILGLSLFYLDRIEQAEEAVLEYLKLEPEAHLDPVLHPPAAVLFFENVRTRNAATIDKHRQSVETRRFVVAMLPPLAQLQNKHSRKAIVIGGVGLLLAATHFGAGAYLRSRCEADGTCVLSDRMFKRMKWATNISGALGIGLLAYGVIDGVWHYRRWKRSQRAFVEGVSFDVAPVGDGALGVLHGSF